MLIPPRLLVSSRFSSFFLLPLRRYSVFTLTSDSRHTQEARFEAASSAALCVPPQKLVPAANNTKLELC